MSLTLQQYIGTYRQIVALLNTLRSTSANINKLFKLHEDKYITNRGRYTVNTVTIVPASDLYKITNTTDFILRKSMYGWSNQEYYTILFSAFVEQDICPNFCFTYGPLNDGPQLPLILQENVSFMSESRSIIRTLNHISTFPEEVIIDCVMQCFMAITCLQSNNFGHFNLTPNNVVIKRVAKSSFVYKFGGTKQRINTEYVAQLIGFEHTGPLTMAANTYKNVAYESIAQYRRQGGHPLISEDQITVNTVDFITLIFGMLGSKKPKLHQFLMHSLHCVVNDKDNASRLEGLCEVYSLVRPSGLFHTLSRMLSSDTVFDMRKKYVVPLYIQHKTPTHDMDTSDIVGREIEFSPITTKRQRDIVHEPLTGGGGKRSPKAQVTFTRQQTVSEDDEPHAKNDDSFVSLMKHTKLSEKEMSPIAGGNESPMSPPYIKHMAKQFDEPAESPIFAGDISPIHHVESTPSPIAGGGSSPISPHYVKHIATHLDAPSHTPSPIAGGESPMTNEYLRHMAAQLNTPVDANMSLVAGSPSVKRSARRSLHNIFETSEEDQPDIFDFSDLQSQLGNTTDPESEIHFTDSRKRMSASRLEDPRDAKEHRTDDIDPMTGLIEPLRSRKIRKPYNLE